jgi:hypothetical protein
MYYIKATLKDGVSKWDNTFVYHLGLNVHPDPDKSSVLCSRGIHLAKNLRSAMMLCPSAVEFYLAKPGVILAEDAEKVRVAYCFLIKLINKDQLLILKRHEHICPDELLSIREEWGYLFDTGGIAGKKWIERYLLQYPFIDERNQGLQLIKDGKTVSNIKNSISKTDLKTVLRSHK